MAKSKTRLSEEVSEFIDALHHPLRNEIEELRAVIINANKGLTENIKWNSPNYCFEGNDRITMRIQSLKQLQLIFHRGAKVQKPPKGRLISDASGLLDWKANDRAVATFKNREDIASLKAVVSKIINEWVKVA